MMMDIQGLPAIGGPAHGFFYAPNGSTLMVADHTLDAPVTEHHMLGAPVTAHGYRRETIQVVLGTMRLEGEFWLWNRLDVRSERVVQLALSLLLAHTVNVSPA